MSRKQATTLACSKAVAKMVKRAAGGARLSMYEYVNQALLHFIRNANVEIRVKENEDSQ